VPVRLAWQQDRGFRLAASRNNAVAMARGHILIFLDGDLVPEEDFVQQHFCAHPNPGIIAVGKRLWRNPEAVARHEWNINDLWQILRSNAARDFQSKIVESISLLGQHWRLKAKPWTSIQGCNISVTNSPLIRFDEEMVGWGFEDVELAYSLNAVHAYEVVHVEAMAYDIQGWVDPREAWKQSDYIAHLCNGFRFLDRWAHVGLTAEEAIPRHHFDPETGLWSMTSIRKAREDTFDYQFMRDWLVEHGHLPRATASNSLHSNRQKDSDASTA
jgi:glycosyltransferase involved in cell wall biosynthesis